MLDFVGNEFGVGDLIVYPKMSGRSVALVKGRVLKFNKNGSVQIQPEMESWQGGRERSGTTRYIDSRTGKGFDPYHDNADQHMASPRGYRHQETGEFIDSDTFYEKLNGLSWGERTTIRDSFKYEECVWKDYVKLENKVKPVTITRTDNIILVSGV